MSETTHPAPSRRRQREAKKLSVQFRVVESQHDALLHAAEQEGDDLASWCRRHLLKLAGWKPQQPEHN